MWSIEYSREVRNYIYDSYPYTEQIWQAIKSLRQTLDGLPDNDWMQLELNTYRWEVANHLVIYQRIVAQKKLIITVLKPFGSEISSI